jgi:hypothetical protein
MSLKVVIVAHYTVYQKQKCMYSVIVGVAIMKIVYLIDTELFAVYHHKEFDPDWFSSRKPSGFACVISFKARLNVMSI